jgi:glucose/mannose-6-phosphate isomerase
MAGIDKAEARRNAEAILGVLRGFNDDLSDGEAAGLELGLPLARRVTFGGVGGSGAFADSVKAVYEPPSSIPVRVVKDYHLPSGSTPGDLLFATSYSGDTEETLSLVDEASTACWQIAAACSGGALMERARNARLPLVKMPLGRQPRFAYPFSFGVGKAVVEMVSGAKLGKFPRLDVEWCEEIGAVLASEFAGLTPVVVSWGPVQSTAHRWASQLGENSKQLAFVQELPEMNHNQIVAWRESAGAKDHIVLLIRDHGAPPEIRRRFDATYEMLAGRKDGAEVQSLHLGDDEDPAVGVLESVLIGDFASVYLAMEKGVDPLPVRPIQELKAMMRAKARDKRLKLGK